VDKIAVLVTGGREEMLLGVPKIGHGTGKQQAEACLTTLDECGIRQQICGLVFDTTASNTGLKNGACTVLSSSIRFTTRWLGGLQVSCHGAGAGAGQYLSGTLWAGNDSKIL